MADQASGGDLLRERDFYRHQTDELGRQVLRLQRELTTLRHETRRNRTTTQVVRAIYRCASEALPFEQIGEYLVGLLVDTLSCECAAILAWNDAGAGFEPRHTRGLANDVHLPAMGEVTCDSLSDQSRCPELALAIGEHTGLVRWIWSSLENPPLALLVGDRKANRIGRGTFDAGDSGTIEAAIGAYRSIEELKRIDRALRASEANYRTIFESVNNAITVADGIHGFIVDANHQALELLGYSTQELRKCMVTDLFKPSTDCSSAMIEERISKAFDGAPQLFTACGLRSNGETFAAEVNLNIATISERRRLVVVMRDISKRVQAERELRYSALHDTLTDLPNRVLMHDRLEQAYRRYRRNPNYIFSLLFLDLNRFKVINDSLGHTVGDQLLIAIGQRLSSIMRPSDTVARIGGDEFVVLVDDLSEAEDAQITARRIQTTLQRPFEIAGHRIDIDVSIGIALNYTSINGPEDLLRDADIAMYKAKYGSGERIAVFDPQMHRQAMDRMQLERDLRRAISIGELTLVYQPVLELATQRIIGFEALARWRHPEKGLIVPDSFIPLAEETGLIVSLGQAVLEMACADLRHWEVREPNAFPLFIGINLSAKQLERQELATEIIRIIKHYECDCRHLAFEITETALMANTVAAEHTLRMLRDQGCRVYMDDFGTGYSSLSYLHQFSIDALKIDRSFVNALSGNSEGGQIINTIIALGHNLGKQIVAEGIETLEQYEQLVQLNCDYGQGYLFSHPVESVQVERLLRDGHLCCVNCR